MADMIFKAVMTDINFDLPPPTAMPSSPLTTINIPEPHISLSKFVYNCYS